MWKRKIFKNTHIHDVPLGQKEVKELKYNAGATVRFGFFIHFRPDGAEEIIIIIIIIVDRVWRVELYRVRYERTQKKNLFQKHIKRRRTINDNELIGAAQYFGPDGLGLKWFFNFHFFMLHTFCANFQCFHACAPQIKLAFSLSRLEPIWTYGLQLRGNAKRKNRIQAFQNITLRIRRHTYQIIPSILI